jgi:hypothetical protein
MTIVTVLHGIDGDCVQGIQYLRASDSTLQQSPDSEFFMSPEETR